MFLFIILAPGVADDVTCRSAELKYRVFCQCNIQTNRLPINYHLIDQSIAKQPFSMWSRSFIFNCSVSISTEMHSA